MVEAIKLHRKVSYVDHETGLRICIDNKDRLIRIEERDCFSISWDNSVDVYFISQMGEIKEGNYYGLYQSWEIFNGKIKRTESAMVSDNEDNGQIVTFNYDEDNDEFIQSSYYSVMDVLYTERVKPFVKDMNNVTRDEALQLKLLYDLDSLPDIPSLTDIDGGPVFL